ncbi:MAG: CsgG/HfaB family protein [bacterium]|nr:CsgG/HfaB family protein [bacterium]
MSFFVKHGIFFSFVLASIMLPSVALAQEASSSQTPASSATSSSEAADLNTPMEDPYKVAVKSFTSGKYTYNNRELNPGRDIARILEGRLSKNRFEIMSRSEALSEVLDEQKLNTSGLFAKDTVNNIGELEGVEYLITGNITEFHIVKGKTKSSSFIFTTTTKEPDKVNVSIEVGIVDCESGRIISNASVRKTYTLGEKSTYTSTENGVIGANDKSEDTLSGITNMYYEIAEELAQQINNAKFQARAPKVVLKGTVAASDGDFVYIKMGRNQGVTTKMIFKVVRKHNGVDITIAEIQPTSVDEEQSECKIIERRKDGNGNPRVIKPGDMFISKFK